MTLVHTLDMSSAGFTLYFLGYASPVDPASEPSAHSIATYEGLLELTWNHGTESQPSFAYHDGNTAPLGFGHISVSVDDLGAACARWEQLGVRWKQRLGDGGGAWDTAFLLDPDGYWIEVFLSPFPPLSEKKFIIDYSIWRSRTR